AGEPASPHEQARDDEEVGAEAHDLHPVVHPSLAPDRLLRIGAVEDVHGLRDAQAATKRVEIAAEPALLVVAAAEEDQIEGPPGIELPLRRDEERALRELRGALRGGAGEVLVVGVAEEDGAQPLLDADA